jgi:seryl-tRNA synthetase
MLDIKFIRENPEKLKETLKNRGVILDVDYFLRIDEEKRQKIKEAEEMRHKQRELDRSEIKEAKALKNQIKEKEKILTEIESETDILLKQIPNLPLEDVPLGKDESANKILRETGEKPKFDFQPKNYLELAEKLDLIDIERASKVSGSRFGFLKNDAVLLELALVQFVFEVLVKKYNFIPLIPPVMIKEEMMKAMGYIDSEKDKEERYFLEKDKLYLVGTSEQSIGPMHAGEILQADELPKKYLAFSTCFRREAGSYGKDTSGILRVHQFDKIEMFIFAKPEDSGKEHQLILKIEEELMQALKIPYRVVQLCTGDLAHPSAATYDIEAWLPGQNQYRETHSTSNCTDYQARRLNIRYKPANRFVHTLNGTALALGRTIIAIIENYQQKDGTIKIPEVLQKYLGNEIKKKKVY